MTPFILKGANKLPSETLPTDGCIYDPVQQLWIDFRTGGPLVLSKFVNTTTPFGKTLITETRESADQPEASLMPVSRFGETLLTRTLEAADQNEITSLIPILPCNSSAIESERSTNKLDFHFIRQFAIDAPNSHF